MEIVLSFWNVLAMMAPWLLVGFLLAGVASVLLPRKWVVGVMGRALGWRGVLNAVLIGACVVGTSGRRRICRTRCT